MAYYKDIDKLINTHVTFVLSIKNDVVYWWSYHFFRTTVNCCAWYILYHT